MPCLLYSAMCCLIIMILCCFGLMSWCVYVIALRCFYCKFRQDQGKVADHILEMYRAQTGPSGKRELLRSLFVKTEGSKFWTMDTSNPRFQEQSTRSNEVHDKHRHTARPRLVWEALTPGGPRISILTHCNVCAYMRLGGFVILVLMILMV